MKTPKTSQTQFKRGTAPQEHVMPHSMDNREAGASRALKTRNSLSLGQQTEARPGLSGNLSHRNPQKRGR
jgi:hypothetical protein